MRGYTLLLLMPAALSGDAFYLTPPTSAFRAGMRSATPASSCQSVNTGSGDLERQDGPSSVGEERAATQSSRKTFLDTTSVGLLAALAWTGATEDALAGPARPSARGLAETSIQLIGTAKQAIDVTVLYPKQWTVTKTPGKRISIQDYKFTDRAFSISEPLPQGKKNVDDLPVAFFTDALFNLNGPYGNFGKVDDFKVIEAKTESHGKRTYRYVDLKFSALTQGLLQVERRACVASTIVGNDVVIFTASVLASRWDKISPIVAEMIESYRADVPQKTPDPTSFAFNRA